MNKPLKQYRDNPSYDHYHGAVKQDGICMTNPYMGEFSKLPLISISIPLYDEQQQLMGAAGMDMHFQAYYNHLMSLT